MFRLNDSSKGTPAKEKLTLNEQRIGSDNYYLPFLSGWPNRTRNRHNEEQEIKSAKTDEELKAKEKKEEEARKRKEEEEASLEEQVRRIKDIEAIESESFVAQAFKSTRDGKKAIEPAEIKQEPDSADTSHDKVDLSIPTTIRYHDSNTLAHPNLFVDKEEAEEKWLNRLIALRQERLMGSPVP
ncbi:hypothetical protein Z043-105710 [Arapaima gigas]